MRTKPKTKTCNHEHRESLRPSENYPDKLSHRRKPHNRERKKMSKNTRETARETARVYHANQIYIKDTESGRLNVIEDSYYFIEDGLIFIPYGQDKAASDKEPPTFRVFPIASIDEIKGVSLEYAPTRNQIEWWMYEGAKYFGTYEEDDIEIM